MASQSRYRGAQGRPAGSAVCLEGEIFAAQRPWHRFLAATLKQSNAASFRYRDDLAE
ncbi:MAG: hypothetical protein [Olavius algarvensis Gamma 3 endosymbiont]|nr:MAG: hypothetical protein [Olavius algarvensis Gamma 3 endosymbiont]